MPRTIIIGAGHGGSQCAVSLRQAGYSGEIVLFDDEAVPYPYHKPPLSKKYLADVEPRLTPLRAMSAYEKADVQIQRKRVMSLDTDMQTVCFDEDESLHYDSLVLATGARNRSLPPFGGVRNVSTLRTSSDAMQMRKALEGANNIMVLGGGFIGLELAASLKGIGRNVHVIEAEDRVLSRVAAKPVSTMVEAMLRKTGVVLSLDSKASEFEIQDHLLNSIQIDDNANLNCDYLVVGIGAIPVTELAEQSNIACDNGIVVNEYLQSSADHVYAIGDCANFPHWQINEQIGDEQIRLESVQNAVDQAKCVATSIAGGEPCVYKTVPWFWSDIGPMKLQIAGIHSGNTQKYVRQQDDKLAVYHLVNGRVVCVESINSAKDHLFARKAIEQGIELDEQTILKGPEHLKSLL